MATTYKNLPKDSIDGYLAYVKISKPNLNTFGAEPKQEYSLNVFISEKQAKEFKKRVVEGKKINKTIKEIETSAFKDKYKFDPPFPDQDDQYFITITQNVNKTNGEPLPDFLRPKSYLYVDKGEGKYGTKDITDQEIGNGSFGTVRYHQQDGINGISIKLDAVLVKDFIPYVSTNKDEWAALAEDSPVTKPIVNTSSTPVATKTEEEDDLPF